MSGYCTSVSHIYWIHIQQTKIILEMYTYFVGRSTREYIMSMCVDGRVYHLVDSTHATVVWRTIYSNSDFCGSSRWSCRAVRHAVRYSRASTERAIIWRGARVTDANTRVAHTCEKRETLFESCDRCRIIVRRGEVSEACTRRPSRP